MIEPVIRMCNSRTTASGPDQVAAFEQDDNEGVLGGKVATVWAVK